MIIQKSLKGGRFDQISIPERSFNNKKPNSVYSLIKELT